MRVSSTPPLSCASRISGQVIAVSGILARRVQQESDCPASVTGVHVYEAAGRRSLCIWPEEVGRPVGSLAQAHRELEGD